MTEMAGEAPDVTAVLERAFRFGDEGDWDGMADTLLAALEDFPGVAAVHCWLGVAERELGMEGSAYERFRAALSLEPEDPHVLATAGAGLARFDDPDAEQALRTAALIAPHEALTRLMYGAYLSREGFREDALRELTAARELSPDDPQIAYEMGVALALSGRGGPAVDAVGEAVRLDPDDSWSRAVLGLLLFEDDRLDEAVPELLVAARGRPEDVEIQLVAALAAAAAGEDGAAYEMLERARMRGAEGDLALVAAVEDRLDRGSEASARFLTDEVVPEALRARLSERP